MNYEPKIRFPGFSGDWKQRKLGDALDDIYNGQTPSRNKSEYWNGNIKWLSSGELNRGIVYDSIETITEDGQKSANLRIIPNGTFVMAITGLEAAGTRGNCALLGFDTTLNQSCMALFPKKDLLTSDFLFQWYRKVGEKYGLNYTQGTKQQSYNAELIKILPISLPVVAEQKKIASYLSCLDHLIALHQRKVDDLKELKKVLLKKMFPQNGEKVPEIRFPEFDGDWELHKVSEIASEKLSNGIMNHQANDDTGLRHINVINMYDSDKIHTEKLSFSSYDEDDVKKCNVEWGDIFLTRSSLKPEGIAEANVLLDVGRFVYDDHLIRLKINKEKNNPFFVKLNLSGRVFKRQFIARAKTTAFTTIGQEDIAECSGFFPTKEEQEKIGSFISCLDGLITEHQRKLDDVKELKKGLLQQMFV